MQGPLGLFLELLPELKEKIVDGTQRPVVVDPPDRRLDLLARKDAPFRLNQAQEHVEFCRGQLDQRPRPVNLAGLGADRDIGEANLFRLDPAQPGFTAQHGLHTSEQFCQPEGLGHVVFRPQLQAHDLVHLGPASAEHHHRGKDLALAKVTQHLEAIQLGQHDVQDDEIEGGRAGKIEPIFAVHSELNLVPLGGEVHFEAHRDAVVVFDNQDALGGGGLRTNHERSVKSLPHAFRANNHAHQELNGSRVGEHPAGNSR